MEIEASSAGKTPRRSWPWVMVAVVIFGIVLAVVWVRAEARRIHEQRQTTMPPPGGTIR